MKPTEEKRLVPRNEKGQILPGYSGNPGGRFKGLVALERMLDDEHRSPEQLREVFTRLRALALGELVTVYDEHGKEVGVELKARPEFMKMYLDRVIGPVADGEVIDGKVEKRLREMLEFAEEEARRRTIEAKEKP